MDARLHPDANLLSAFLEGGLDDAARRTLLHHLSACDHCRRLAATVNTVWDRAIFSPPPPRLWMQTPWAVALATAAGVVLAAGLWTLVPTPVTPHPRLLAARPASPTQIHRLVASNVVPRPRTAAVFVVPAPAVLAASADPPPALPSVPVPPPSGEISPSIDFSPLMTGFQDQAPAPGYTAQLASWTESADPGASTPAAATPTPAAPPTLAASSSVATSAFGENLVGGSALSTASLSGPLAPILSTGATGLGWTISRGGQLLRSIGAGMWAAVPLVPGLHLHAVSTSDSRIWAAGLADQLFVSEDRGAHWSQIHLPGISSHAAPIHSISFSDAKHGAITADGGDTWITTDGGATWKKKASGQQ